MAHPDLDKLYTMLIDRAQELLSRNNDMYQIAASMSREREIQPVMAYWGDEHPSSQKVIDELSSLLVAQAVPDKTNALGLAYDIRYSENRESPKRDAIKVDLEHANGDLACTRFR
jgi:hypothetical protein